jgi:hypothetical protein
MHRIALFLLALAATVAWSAEDYSCMEQPRHRQFDFWAGSWRVTDRAGDKTYGNNTISIEQGGCLLRESWRGAGGSSGGSLNYYDPRDQMWHQLWVDKGASIITIAGNMEDGSMVLTGNIYYLAERRQADFRGTWTPLPDGRIRQFFEERDGEGKWQPWFDGYYLRAGEADRNSDG